MGSQKDPTRTLEGSNRDTMGIPQGNLTFKILYFIKDAPRVLCYDNNFDRYRTIGPFKKGDVVELPPSCADVYLEMSVARLATEDEVVETYSRKYGIDREKLRRFLSELRQQQ